MEKLYFTDRVMDFQLDDESILLINTISSAFDIIDSDTYERIEEMKKGYSNFDDKDELMQTLIKRGYVFEQKEKEQEFIRKYAEIHQKYIEKNLVRSFTICPTMGCNLRCTYCFEGDENLSNKKVMTEEQLTIILNYIDTCITAQTEIDTPKTSISLFGGEPLLPQNMPIVQKTLDFAKARDIEVRIVTNGTTIKYYSKLLKMYDNVIIQITLDGSKSIHDVRRIGVSGRGTFDLIESSIDLLIEMKIKTHLRTNINQDNIDSLSDLVQFIKEKKWVESGYVYPYVAPVLEYCDGSNNSMKESELYSRVLEIEPTLGSEDSIIKMVVSPCVNYLQSFFDSNNQMKPWKLNYCEATSGGNLVFSPDGNISTCLMLAGKGHHQIGSYDGESVKLDPNLEGMWKDRTILRIPQCKECKYGLICGGGCPIAAIDINQDIDCPVCSDIEDTMKAFVNTRKRQILQKV
ncbi:hypothetical protein CA600_09635 [Paenibacillus sp. VTT E-133280]|uniref:radical SAM/SPASM domain-containing protein n=1 Tax=Paenibacillus sp. VTT E-133280 TaxID=1986222 RepID=UPI000BA099CA|nr:radical SAM protein [Paenibacillus sp. VTT E-133280]OZQ67101.1 hypothetical protein CA600_09635 [Paenibacillus sp. VTT E-133280]